MTNEEQWQWICRMEEEHRAQGLLFKQREFKERQAQELLALQLQIQATRTHYCLVYMMFNPSPKPEIAAAILGETP